MKAHPPYFILQKTTEFGENISIFTLTRNSENEMKHRLKYSYNLLIKIIFESQ